MLSPLWTHRLVAPAGGVALARESGHTLAWDLNGWLVLLDRRGRVQARVRHSAGMVAATIAEDGTTLADADDRGTVTMRRPDLVARWSVTLERRPTALAIDTLGRCVAVATASGQLQVLTGDGRAAWAPPLATPRPLHHLAFSATSATLCGAADFGLVASVDLARRRLAWHDSPVVHLGGLAVVGDPPAVAVACFSEGVRRYRATGAPLSTLATPEPCRLIAADYAGRRILVSGAFGGVHLLAESGTVLADERTEMPAVGLALSASGDTAVVALADGAISAYKLPD